jgi:hypothetical protein
MFAIPLEYTSSNVEIHSSQYNTAEIPVFEGYGYTNIPAYNLIEADGVDYYKLSEVLFNSQIKSKGYTGDVDYLNYFEKKYYLNIMPSDNVINYMDSVKVNAITKISRIVPSISDRLKSLSVVESNWDGDNAKPMSLSSILNLEKLFLSMTKYPDDIGVFLGYDGEVIVNWTFGGNLVDLYVYNKSATISYLDNEFDVDIDSLADCIENYV